jgi:hypothetical protein
MVASILYAIKDTSAVLWHLEPLLGNDREIAAVQQTMQGNDPVNKGSC